MVKPKLKPVMKAKNKPVVKAKSTDKEQRILGVPAKMAVVVEHHVPATKFSPEATDTLIRIKDKLILDILQDYFEEDEVYQSPATLSMYWFQLHMPTLLELKYRFPEENDLRSCYAKILAAADQLCGNRTQIVSQMVAKGNIRFDLLPYLFSADTKFVYVTQNNSLEGGRVHSAKVRHGFFGPYLQVTYRSLKSNGTNLTFDDDQINIPAFTGLAKLSDLPIRIPTDEEYQKLVARGKKYIELSLKPFHMEYKGRMQFRAGWFNKEIDATGRTMIDVNSYYRVTEGHRDSNDKPLKDAPSDDMLFTCSSMIYGFSLKKKCWGKFELEGFSPVSYNRSSFEKLVLDPKIKNQMTSLISNQGKLYSDFISGKGGGIIALLAGNPGVGKTATAETIAEYMERPFYSISVGELGINPTQLEENLQNVLNLASFWNAIVLLDEGDIYLSKRQDGDILRNAMTGVFLKHLEYHNGVVFVTTNRSHDLDPAILSRMSILLKYPDFDTDARRKVWDTILKDAGLSVDARVWHSRDMNGRVIKNVIRTAQAMGGENVESNIKDVLYQHDVFYGNVPAKKSNSST